MKALNADFFLSMKEGAEAFATQHPEINLISVGTNSQTEIDCQIELVQDLIKKKSRCNCTCSN